MQFALNMMFVAPGVAGGRVYCDGLLRGLAAVDPHNEYFLFTRRDVELPNLPPERFHQVRAPVSGSSAVWRTIWEYGMLKRQEQARSAALLHGLGSLSPACPNIPFVLTIHDLIYRHFPESLPLGYRKFMDWMHPGVTRRADRVIVPSKQSARDVVQILGVPEERVRIVHYGPGHALAPVVDPERITAVLAKHRLRQPFLLSVCRAYAHKNLAGLLRAMDRLRALGHADVRLVLVGEPYRTGDALAELARSLHLEDVVVFTGFVDNADMSALYSAAAAFAFPSLAEGYGLPLLEAMACGVPVVASNASAIPEAVGDAGVLVDARDPEDFARGLARVLEDRPLREELRQKGLARHKEFSWEKCAAETLAVYREVL